METKTHRHAIAYQGIVRGGVELWPPLPLIRRRPTPLQTRGVTLGNTGRRVNRGLSGLYSPTCYLSTCLPTHLSTCIFTWLLFHFTSLLDSLSINPPTYLCVLFLLHLFA
ncbi:hypothetical protein E2C01_077014 [Portunus trituberculatus]|uniref:Uncharacterized protein n=1 Tax=Portunus trituberculatus TaxID=210409 RepID=A0A5B7IJ55_PORTR|nr:hypothetical protein [Portunus trituberculatus]